MTRRAEVACLLAVTLAAAVAASDLATPGFYAGHDNLLNVHRLFELERCFEEGQWLCIWAPDMGAGMGIPLFQYYAPLPTYGTAGLRALGLSLTSSVQASAGLALFVLALGAFGLGRSLWGTLGGTLTGTLAVMAPYVALDVYVRGALNETWALAILPWVLWGSRALAQGAGSAAAIGMALSGAALILAHPLVCIAVSPLYATWLALHGLDGKRAKAVLGQLAPAHVVAFLVSAFYWLPVALERDAIGRGALIARYDWSQWHNNFVSLLELVVGTGPWDYGPFRTEGGMSVFAGSFALAAAAAGVVAARSGSAAEQAPDGASPRRITSWVACGTTLTLVLATPLCAPLWSRLPALAYLQFPWRFLGPGSLGLAVLGGACVLELRRRTSGPIALALTLVACLGITAWNSRYFQAEAQAVVEDDVLANPLQLARMRHGMFDYLPTAVDPAAIPQRPSGARPREAVALPEGSARVRALFRGSHRLALQVEAEHETLLRIQRHDFPRWQVRIDGYAAELEPVDDPRGRLHVRVPAGVHEVTATLEATGARWAGRGLSLLGLLALFALPWLRVRPTPAKGRTQ